MYTLNVLTGEKKTKLNLNVKVATYYLSEPLKNTFQYSQFHDI